MRYMLGGSFRSSYTPLNENWTISIFDHYAPSYWIEEALSAQYRSRLKQAFTAFAKHCRDKKWHDTILEFYLNGKVYHRKDTRKTSSPWIS